MEALETSVEYLLKGDKIEEIEKQIEEIDNVLAHRDELKEYADVEDDMRQVIERFDKKLGRTVSMSV